MSQPAKQNASEFETPMMKQYFAIKENYADCLLFFRLGDFYELFMDDAKIGAEVLDITLTSRDRGKDGRIPMAGVPFHAVDSYLSKLVRAGYKVAICEQLTEPDGTGLVERDVVRIVTPGTVLDETSLEKKENNYIMSLSYDDESLGIAVADISTGVFQFAQYPAVDLDQTLTNLVSRFNPSECILSLHLYNQPNLLKTLRSNKSINIFLFNEWVEYAQNAYKLISNHLGVKSLDIFGLVDKSHALKSAGALLGYLKYTQKDKIGHIKNIVNLNETEYLELDRSTILNLELFTTIREGNKKGSLIHLLDNTITPMGGRLLRNWLLHPLKDKVSILNRHQAVDEFIRNPALALGLAEKLALISDIERLLSRLSIGIGNARDLVNLKNSLVIALECKTLLEQANSALAKEIVLGIPPKIEKAIKLIETRITAEPPIDVRNGGMINAGVNKELDDLKAGINDSKIWIAQLEQKEKARTGISSLKVKFNQVFGYYIEITKSYLDLVPSNYYRKQTLVNAERYITEELKHHETIILTAEEKIKDMEYRLFGETVSMLAEYTVAIQAAAKEIAVLDCILNFAKISIKENYVRPTINDLDELTIVEGRHPVVEQLLEDTQFVPNDTRLSNEHQLNIITGPNMAGKSVYIRQVALLVLLNQIGCFVPAKNADLCLVDKIFVRSGASDVITSGLSTFMVEMVETAYILHNATNSSLIVMDEIGRGTSTYDGVSIAWAVAEYLVSNGHVHPKTLFATHYHELQNLEAKYIGRVQNFQVSAKEENGRLNFLHKLVEGGASHSYGIAVARLAGVPEEVTTKATELLKRLETRPLNGKENPLTNKLQQLAIEKITPLEAIKILEDLKALI